MKLRGWLVRFLWYAPIWPVHTLHVKKFMRHLIMWANKQNQVCPIWPVQESGVKLCDQCTCTLYVTGE